MHPTLLHRSHEISTPVRSKISLAAWSIKGEYLHLGFGSQSYDFTTPFGGSLGGGISVSGTAAVHADVKTDFDIARVGVNYRF
jgi:outer membrane immunogenic protein